LATLLPKTARGPANSLRLDATLTISQQNIVIYGTWIDTSETRIISSVSSFRLNHTSVAESTNTMLNGSFLFNGSFQYNKRKPIVEDNVELSLSRLDNRTVSVCGWGMNKLGLFNISGGGMKNNADGSESKFSSTKTEGASGSPRMLPSRLHIPHPPRQMPI